MEVTLKPHPNAGWIKAWADGAVLEARYADKWIPAFIRDILEAEELRFALVQPPDAEGWRKNLRGENPAWGAYIDADVDAELQRDHSEQRRNALMPEGEAKEQCLYEWTTKLMEQPDDWAKEIATDVCATHAEEILSCVAGFKWADLINSLNFKMRAAFRQRAEEAFADHDWEAE